MSLTLIVAFLLPLSVLAQSAQSAQSSSPAKPPASPTSSPAAVPSPKTGASTSPAAAPVSPVPHALTDADARLYERSQRIVSDAQQQLSNAIIRRDAVISMIREKYQCPDCIIDDRAATQDDILTSQYMLVKPVRQAPPKEPAKK